MARYNGPTNGDDEARALAVDGAGNTYVTGYSAGNGTDLDYATVKYDRARNQLWVAQYNGPGNSTDDAVAIAVDSDGNVYVTGYSWGNGTYYDYATVKYDNNGNQLWVARYNGPNNWFDKAAALRLDEYGNIYVTGLSGGVGTSEDYATVKYDPSGNQLWVARYDGPARTGDYATALAIDNSGNVYVTGQSVGGFWDYATLKYDTYGNYQWVARYNGPIGSSDLPCAMVVDGAGNAYVTGYSWGGTKGTMDDYATVKYDAAGNQLWAARYDGPGGRSDSASAVGVDASGNVYVTGYSYASDSWLDYATVKYDADGNQQWVARYDAARGTDEATALVVDAAGGIYVTGYSSATGAQDYTTIKYDGDGNQLWEMRYDGPANSTDRAQALAVNGSSVYVTGHSMGSGTDFDYATIRYALPVEIDFSHTPSSVPRGQTASWRYHLTNSAETTQTFEWWLTITGRRTLEEYLGTKTLAPRETESGTLRLQVPGNTPLGRYTICGRVGVYATRTVWDEDCFECRVVR